MRWHGNIQRCGRFIAKIGWYGEPLLLNFRLRIGYKLMKGHRMHGDTLLNQAKEEHTAMSGFAAVEPEHKFVQISLQVIFFEGALVSPHQPTLNERCDTVYARQNLVGFFAGTLDGRTLMDVIVFRGTGIGYQSIRADGRARFDVLLNKGFERFGFGVGDNLQAATPKPLWGEQFYGDGHQHLTFGTAPALALAHASKDSLIHFNVSGQHIVTGMADCAPEPVQHRPGCLIGAKSKNSMQRFGGNPIFSCGQVPSGSEPNSQGRSGVMKDCASRGGDSISARIAPPLAILHAPALRAVTRRALKPVLPSNPVKIVEAGSVIRKPRQKLGVVARVINPRLGSFALSGSVL